MLFVVFLPFHLSVSLFSRIFPRISKHAFPSFTPNIHIRVTCTRLILGTMVNVDNSNAQLQGITGYEVIRIISSMVLEDLERASSSQVSIPKRGIQRLKIVSICVILLRSKAFDIKLANIGNTFSSKYDRSITRRQ